MDLIKTHPLRKKIYRVAKRFVDLLGSLLGLTFFFAALPILSFIIKWDSPGPVFFIQTRVGQFGRKFKFIKLRTMRMDAHLKQWELDELNETGGLTFKIKDDPRVTRIGQFLRRTSLDEMPQFWNVLTGEMTLVGPRPPLLREVAHYNALQKVRMTVPQGMTGLWQVRGRSTLGFTEMVDLDVQYALKANFFLDARILFYTLPTVMVGRGAT